MRRRGEENRMNESERNETKRRERRNERWSTGGESERKEKKKLGF